MKFGSFRLIDGELNSDIRRSLLYTILSSATIPFCGRCFNCFHFASRSLNQFDFVCLLYRVLFKLNSLVTCNIRCIQWILFQNCTLKKCQIFFFRFVHYHQQDFF